VTKAKLEGPGLKDPALQKKGLLVAGVQDLTPLCSYKVQLGVEA
jgi:hypothetical protein